MCDYRGPRGPVTMYADSSALIPLYVSERFSESAEAVLRGAGPLPFTALHQLEISNAFERLVGRELMTREECDSVQRQLRDDVDSHRLTPISIDLDEVFAHASELSTRYAARHLAGSLSTCYTLRRHMRRNARGSSQPTIASWRWRRRAASGSLTSSAARGRSVEASQRPGSRC